MLKMRSVVTTDTHTHTHAHGMNRNEFVYRCNLCLKRTFRLVSLPNLNNNDDLRITREHDVKKNTRRKSV